MSHQLYDKVWRSALDTLGSAATLDAILQSAKPEKDRKLSISLISGLYTKYSMVVNRLDICYDQMVQPQKRILLRKMLDASIGRLLEIKHELVTLQLSEYALVGDALLELGTLPQDAEPPVPRYYRRQRQKEIAQRKHQLDTILRKLGVYDEQGKAAAVSEEVAIRLIQCHERARQGRLRANFMRELTLIKFKYRPSPASKSAVASVTSLDEAALVIQKTWRGVLSRRNTKKLRHQEMELIGMQLPEEQSDEQKKRALEVEGARRKTQREYQLAFENACIDEKERITRLQTLRLTRDISDEVRTWIMDYKNETGKFPDLPTAEEGGSGLLFGKQGTESEVSKSTAGSSRDSKSVKKQDRSKGTREVETKKDKAGAEDEDPGFKMQPSNFLGGLLSSNAEYDEVWRHRAEEDNPLQRHYNDMIHTEKQFEVEKELRLLVDEALRCELELLKAALDRDRAKRGKKVKKSGKKGRKGGKKGKKKREKDLTPDRTLDSLFEELVTQGIIRRYPDTLLSSFCGEPAVAGTTPGLGDVRRLINEFCILPLGSGWLHQSAPLVRSVLLAGPSGSGKDMLVHAVCSELGAVLFDLSPANLAGKYPGKAGLTMLVHLINKVSRLLQPTVLYMDTAEKPFMKKVPKTDRTDPKRLKKDLPKIVKGIGPDDQIILIGASNNPWECDQKSLLQTYHKLILLPKPDYGSVSSLWQQQLRRLPPHAHKHFNVAAMAKVCDGFPMGTVVRAIQEVLTCKRVMQLTFHPLTHAEFIHCLSKHEPIYREEEEAFHQWYAKTPLGKKQARAQEFEQQCAVPEEKRAKKKKK